jgi:hypothetical protein
VKTVSASGPKKVVKKLKPNKRYEFYVRSVGSTGSKSSWSEALVARTRPIAPQQLRAVDIDTDSARLKWKATRGTVKKYVVTLYDEDNVVIKRVKVKKARVTVDELDAGSTYSFRVRTKFNQNNISGFSKRKTFETTAE